MSKYIFLDMDGVSCNLVQHMFLYLGIDYKSIMDKWVIDYPENYNIHEVIGMEQSEIWKVTEKMEFWETIPKYEWFDELYAYCKTKCNTVFVSAPTESPECISGKLSWVLKLNNSNNDYVFTHRKELFANPNSLLIDDSDKNIKDFIKHGGHGILFPQPWNSNHLLIRNRIGYVYNEINQFLNYE